MLEYLVSRGHDVRIICGHRAYTLNGVEVMPEQNEVSHYRWANVIITHLERTSKAIYLANATKKNVIHIVHNTTKYSVVNGRHYVGVIYNNKYSKDLLKYPNKSTVLYPPINAAYNEKQSGKRKYVTLANLNSNKGGQQLIQIAKLLPEMPFCGVEGFYEHQNIDRAVKNITYLPPQNSVEKMKTVYADSKIILMPSKYESWGLVAAEALAQGIPVIAAPTFGLKENLGEAGIFIDRNDTKAWAKEIKRLYEDDNYYAERCKIAKEAAAKKALIAEKQLQDFEVFCKEMSKENTRSTEYEQVLGVMVKEQNLEVMVKVSVIRNIYYRGNYYRRGEVVEFERSIAESYISHGFAEYYVESQMQKENAPTEHKATEADKVADNPAQEAAPKRARAPRSRSKDVATD
jgi:glycosyltransferase involved in cell wall biosynthesis